MLLMWIVTIGVGIYIAVMYQKIPDVIPTHFGLWGQPDSWGSKTSLLFLYGVSVVMAVIEQWALHAAVKNSDKDRGRQYDEQRYPRGDRTLSRIDLWMVQRGDDLAWKTRKILFLCCPRICCSFVCFHIYQTETGAETGAGERQDQSTARRRSIQNRKTGRYSWNSGYEVSGESGSVGMGAF